jgi:hypothetical protein
MRKKGHEEWSQITENCYQRMSEHQRKNEKSIRYLKASLFTSSSRGTWNSAITGDPNGL